MKKSRIDHVHYLFWFYKYEKDGNYYDSTDVEVVATSYEEALEKARKLVPNHILDKKVMLKNVVEHQKHKDN